MLAAQYRRGAGQCAALRIDHLGARSPARRSIGARARARALGTGSTAAQECGGVQYSARILTWALAHRASLYAKKKGGGPRPALRSLLRNRILRVAEAIVAIDVDECRLEVDL